MGVERVTTLELISSTLLCASVSASVTLRLKAEPTYREPIMASAPSRPTVVTTSAIITSISVMPL